jgi:predicted ester cyclase
MAIQIERNKAVVKRLKDEVSSRGRVEVMRDIAVPGFSPRRRALHNLAQNAQGQEFPAPGEHLREAIPDRVDHIVSIVAEGDRVGMLWRLTGTHLGNLFGIAPTGRKIDVYSVGVFRLENGLIADAWCMADEIGLLQQIGSPLPKRRDGMVVAPLVTGAGEEPAAVKARLSAGSLDTLEDRNKLVAVRSKADTGAAALAQVKPATYVHRRWGMQHLNDYGKANKVGHLNPPFAFPDRHDTIEGFIAEGDTVWMQFRLMGTHTGSFYGSAPTGNRVEMAEIGMLKVVDGVIADGWYFGDELGILLQTNSVQLLLRDGMEPMEPLAR